MTTLPKPIKQQGVLIQMDKGGTHTYTEADLNEMRKKRVAKTKVISKPIKNRTVGKIDLLIK